MSGYIATAKLTTSGNMEAAYGCCFTLFPKEADVLKYVSSVALD